MKKENLKLRRSFVLALLVLLIAFAVATVATFAWYIYSVNAHTTSVHMAAGAGTNLQISNTWDGEFASVTNLSSYVGTLNPVSTDRIQNGFQKVAGFTNGSDTQSLLVANLFKPGTDSDYYLASLYLRTNGNSTDVYISGIGFEDSNPEVPISSAIRIGLVVPTKGEEFIFAISDAKNPEKEYNTATGQEGYVLDSTKTDGSTVPFTPYTTANFCSFDPLTNTASLKDGSVRICRVAGDGQHGYGEAVRVDVYIWLEGCDEDCTRNLIKEALNNVSISFAGFETDGVYAD